MGPTETIAEFVAGTKAGNIPPEALSKAKEHVVDTLAVAFASSNSALSGILREMVGGSGEAESSLWTGTGRSTAADAAWVNGNLSGMEALSAYVVGVEVECKLASLISLEHYGRGWHATAILGTLGSALASAWLLRLPPAKVRHALGIAASMAGG